jgi:hypothetical protein
MNCRRRLARIQQALIGAPPVGRRRIFIRLTTVVGQSPNRWTTSAAKISLSNAVTQSVSACVFGNERELLQQQVDRAMK